MEEITDEMANCIRFCLLHILQVNSALIDIEIDEENSLLILYIVIIGP